MEKSAQPTPEKSSVELVARLTERLPQAWRNETSVTLWPDSIVLHFLDAKGHQHAFDIRRLQLGAKAFVAGESLAYGYLRADKGVQDEHFIEEYRAALKTLAARERDFLALLPTRRSASNAAGAE